MRPNEFEITANKQHVLRKTNTSHTEESVPVAVIVGKKNSRFFPRTLSSATLVLPPPPPPPLFPGERRITSKSRQHDGGNRKKTGCNGSCSRVSAKTCFARPCPNPMRARARSFAGFIFHDSSRPIVRESPRHQSTFEYNTRLRIARNEP